MKAGFYGGIVVDYPNSAKAKKYFLVLMTGGVAKLPAALGTDESAAQIAYNRKQAEYAKKARGKPLKKSREWVLAKKERRRQQGEDTRKDSRFTARKRSGRF